MSQIAKGIPNPALLIITLRVFQTMEFPLLCTFSGILQLCKVSSILIICLEGDTLPRNMDRWTARGNPISYITPPLPTLFAEGIKIKPFDIHFSDSFCYRDNSVHFHECSPFWVGIFFTFNKENFHVYCFK